MLIDAKRGSFASGAWVGIVRAVTPKCTLSSSKQLPFCLPIWFLFALCFPVSISVFIPAFKGSCPMEPPVYLILLGLFLFTGDKALFAVHFLFLGVSKERRLQREGRMHHLKGWCSLCISSLHRVCCGGFTTGKGPQRPLLSVCWERCEDDG